MNNIYKNLTDSISNEFKVFNLDEDVQFSISKIDNFKKISKDKIIYRLKVNLIKNLKY